MDTSLAALAGPVGQLGLAGALFWALREFNRRSDETVKMILHLSERSENRYVEMAKANLEAALAASEATKRACELMQEMQRGELPPRRP